MDGRMDNPKAICPFNFSKVGGIFTLKAPIMTAANGIFCEMFHAFFQNETCRFVSTFGHEQSNNNK